MRALFSSPQVKEGGRRDVGYHATGHAAWELQESGGDGDLSSLSISAEPAWQERDGSAVFFSRGRRGGVWVRRAGGSSQPISVLSRKIMPCLC